MSTRFQEEGIQQFRGKKHAARKETADWMAGPTRPATRTTNRKRPPPLQLQITGAKPTKKARNAGKKVAVQSTYPPVVALPPVSPIVRQPPIATSFVSAVQVASPAESVAEPEWCDEFDALGMANDATLGESDEESAEEVDIEETVQVVTPRRHNESVAPEETPIVHLSITQYQAIIADYQERLVRAE